MRARRAAPRRRRDAAHRTARVTRPSSRPQRGRRRGLRLRRRRPRQRGAERAARRQAARDRRRRAHERARPRARRAGATRRPAVHERRISLGRVNGRRFCVRGRDRRRLGDGPRAGDDAARRDGRRPRRPRLRAGGGAAPARRLRAAARDRGSRPRGARSSSRTTPCSRTRAGPAPLLARGAASSSVSTSPRPERPAGRRRDALLPAGSRSAAGSPGAPGVLTLPRRRPAFAFVCDEPLPLQADGEDLGDVTEAVFEAERDAVDVLVWSNALQIHRPPWRRCFRPSEGFAV